ncbi:hypothetical protein ACFXPX_19640 [Kitasatospora sp. NPDC059146]|uniref:hypothetical protein n=1 Tax=unclassified Kitasatospora TaxID=2633591 RepID=UPI0036AE767D
MIEVMAAAGALLDLVCDTNPDPVTVSTATETKRATVFLTFRRPAGSADVKCRALRVTVPVGTAAGDLSLNTDAAHADDIDDYPRDNGGPEWDIERTTVPPEPTAPGQVTSITFTCTPPSGETTFGAGREFTLLLSNIPVNRTVGAARLTVTETTRPGSGSTDWADRPTGVPVVEKLANEFYVRNFSSRVGRVAHGQSAVLEWEGTPQNSEYYLYWDDEPAKRLPSTVPLTYTTHALTRTTTFVLDAQTRNAANQTVHHYRSTTVTVKDPDVLARTLTAADRLAVHDTFTADRTDARRTWARTTDFTGDVTIS